MSGRIVRIPASVISRDAQGLYARGFGRLDMEPAQFDALRQQYGENFAMECIEITAAGDEEPNFTMLRTFRM